MTRRLDGSLAAALLIGVPLGLLSVLGTPWAASIRGTAIGIAALLAWATWAWCLLGVLSQIVRRVRARDLEVARSARSLDRLAARLAGCALALAALSSSPAGGATSPRGSVVPTTAITAAAPPIASPVEPPIPPSSAATIEVRSGDSLWSIAETLWGDGEQWRRLAAGNLGRVMDDGRLFVDPSLIYPGWRLQVPSDIAPSSVSPSNPSPRASSNAPTASPLPQEIGVPSVPAGAPQAALGEVVPTQALHLSPEGGAHHSATSRATASQAVVIPAVLGSGAVLLGLLRRRRRRRRGGLELDDELVDVEVALELLGIQQETTLLERAVLLAHEDDVLLRPSIMVVDESGARLFENGVQRWRAVPHDLIDSPEVTRAPCALIPLGSVGPTSWTLCVPRGMIGSIAGRGAQGLLEPALELQSEFVWGDLLVPAPDDELGETGTLHVAGPGDLTSPESAVLAVTESDGQADIVVADGEVTIRSLGTSVPLGGLSSAASRLAAEPASIVAPAAVLDGRAPLPPGSVRIRLLRALPAIDGLTSPIEPKRERRGVELLAYLALHSPDPVTGDRLRSRVLGSSDQDAAAKTLFNVASAARRALGADEHGQPLLPPASRHSLYQLSPLVTCDLDELMGHIAAAKTGDEEEALAHLRAALELIESEPLSAILVGWEWFDGEGHRGRLESVVESAALQFVELCVALGHLPLAWQGLERARLVVPYSESLAEVAMDLAAADGDRESLRRAFDDLGRLTESLDPGSWPTTSAEQRYRALRAALEAQASLAAMDAAPRSTKPSAPAAL